ncbi:MAG: serine protease [Blastocatellia bacterium]
MRVLAFRRRSALLVVIVALAAISVSGQSSATALSESFAEVAKRVAPAVVSIETKSRVAEALPDTPPSSGDDLLDYLRRQSRRPVYAVGSGFIIDKAGYIITNNHVVFETSKIKVRLDTGEEFPARIVGSDEETDLAVLKIDAGRELPAIAFGDSSAVRVGDWVLAIGSPFGLARTVTAGIISQTDRDTPTATVFQKFIQTDAAINRGNSGGPLVNLKGEVIGVNSQIATSTGDYNGVGFALPSREAESVYRQILQFGGVRRGYLGVALESARPEFFKVYGLNGVDGGAIVTEVRDSQSPAARAGMRVGDLITEVNGASVKTSVELINKIAATLPESEVRLGVLREKGEGFEKLIFSIRLGERPVTSRTGGENPDRTKILPNTKDSKPLGLTVESPPAAVAATFRNDLPRGVVVKEIDPNSFLADVKSANGTGPALLPGDVIIRVNRRDIATARDFYEITGALKKGDAVVMQVLVHSPAAARTILKFVQFTVQ